MKKKLVMLCLRIFVNLYNATKLGITISMNANRWAYELVKVMNKVIKKRTDNEAGI